MQQPFGCQVCFLFITCMNTVRIPYGRFEHLMISPAVSMSTRFQLKMHRYLLREAEGRLIPTILPVFTTGCHNTQITDNVTDKALDWLIYGMELKVSEVSLQIPFSAVVVDHRESVTIHSLQVFHGFEPLTFQSELHSFSL